MKDSTTFRGNIHYVFAEKLPAMYPGIEIEIKYAGCAYIDGDEVTLFEPISIAIGDGAYKNYPVPNGNGHFDWKTISNLKEAAIRAAWLQNNGLEFGRTMEEMLGRPEKNFIE